MILCPVLTTVVYDCTCILGPVLTTVVYDCTCILGPVLTTVVYDCILCIIVSLCMLWFQLH